ncbi:helix-turn-helix transcriptional regulator [Aquipuribacter sp. SD81]|uniref:helix-turn-helix transcriptional regulator n=1 Tax=Aquipuribacter sp. SD81 TaxID=3127703 RepID=UPI003019DD00
MDSATRHVVPSTRTEPAPVLEVRSRAGGPAAQPVEESLLLSLISTRVTEVALLVQALAGRPAVVHVGEGTEPGTPVPSHRAASQPVTVLHVPRRRTGAVEAPPATGPDGRTTPGPGTAPDPPPGRDGRATPDLLARLSRRELDVLRLMAQGWSNAAVAQRLHVSERTVEATTAHVFRKLELEASPQVNRRVLAVLLLLDAR